MGAASFLVVVGFIVLGAGILWSVVAGDLGLGAATAAHSSALLLFGIVILLLAILVSALKGNSQVGD